MLTKKQILDASKCDIHYCKTCGMLPLCENMYDSDNATRELAKTALAYREMLERLERCSWQRTNIEDLYLCPICRSDRRHKSDCELAKLLKESEEVE